MGTPATETADESVAVARANGLRYVNATDAGITRRTMRGGFSYWTPEGGRVTDEGMLERIRALAIPPAWTDVWIGASALGHIQATGRDARGRKQYRYHARWSAMRDEAKYERTIAFARALPRLRRRVQRDLRAPGVPRRKVLAALVRLLETTLVRVGNEEYARENRSFGLTTLRDRHASVRGSTFKLRFRGKGGKVHEVGLRDRRLARVIRECQDLPGQQLFQYVDESGEVLKIDSDDVNEYLRDAMGDDFSAKDFRTWAGTVLAARAFNDIESLGAGGGPPKRALIHAVETVARALGNTPTVCRRCYIHPAIVDSYLDGSLARTLSRRARATLANRSSSLSEVEELVLGVVRRRLLADSRAAQPRRGAAAGR